MPAYENSVKGTTPKMDSISSASIKDPSSWVSVDFWRVILTQTLEWALKAVPKVIVVLILGVVLVKVLNIAMARLAARAVEHGSGETPAHTRSVSKHY